jgi:hypothetical protein
MDADALEDGVLRIVRAEYLHQRKILRRLLIEHEHDTDRENEIMAAVGAMGRAWLRMDGPPKL